jgi:hypothetical protein
MKLVFKYTIKSYLLLLLLHISFQFLGKILPYVQQLRQFV